MLHDKLTDFFSKYPRIEYHKGDVLLFAHMQITSVYYIESGVVSQYDITASGDKAILNSFKRGAFFPMSNVINDVETAYFFEAEETVQVREVPAHKAVAFIRDNPDVLYDLLQRVLRGTDGLLAKLSSAMHDDAGERILRELYIMSLRFGNRRVEEGLRLQRRVTKVQLAERTGLARETVSRTLKQLESAQKIGVEDGHFILRHDSM